MPIMGFILERERLLVMASDEPKNVKQAFRDKFWTTLRWPKSITSSSALDELFIDFILASEAIAGPMFRYYERGNVDYVFTGRHQVFKNIKTRDQLINWCKQGIDKFKNQVNAVNVKNDRDTQDKKLLLQHISEIEEFIDLFDQCLRRQYP